MLIQLKRSTILANFTLQVPFGWRQKTELSDVAHGAPGAVYTDTGAVTVTAVTTATTMSDLQFSIGFYS